jgi:antitoxin (DNA-binding transcriptional repressor) of toxin-antitoxin stability system
MERINAAIITKHGKAVARLIPASSDCADLMKGKIRVQSDMVSHELKWDAES